ncbi:MAG: lipoyl(octanoyl) transferase LipB [Terracidiphilus sp.]|jgi:lipoyl(octanoyl) transferase
MIQYLYLGRVGYDEGLRLQAEIAGLIAEGRLKNVLLLLEHPPVLTLGRNANRANVLASDEMLARHGVTLHEINRGGDVTYHGPGQLVGYPIFDLRTLKNSSGSRMGPVDFVRGMEEALIRVCGGFGVKAGRVPGLTGVWCGSTANRQQGIGNSSQGLGTEGLRTKDASGGPERKIGAIGIHVSRGVTSHGFAFNVTTDLRDFELIVPCGIRDHAVTSLERELALLGEAAQPDLLPSLETVANASARQFGMVFEQHVLAVESLEALRAVAEAAREFPAEDTPMQVPPEVGRLRGIGDAPIRA